MGKMIGIGMPRIRNLSTHNKRRTRVSDEKMKRMWLGREVVVAGLPPLLRGQLTIS